MASWVASIGGTGQEAVPTQTSSPRRFSESMDALKVSLPTLSYTTEAPTPLVISRTRLATSSCR